MKVQTGSRRVVANIGWTDAARAARWAGHTAVADSLQAGRQHLGDLYASVRKPGGGFTYDVVHGTTPTEGWAVSAHEELSFAKPGAQLKRSDMLKYAHRNADALAQPGNHLGAWHNPENGMVSLDVATVEPDEQKATDLGNAHDQQSIYNLKTGETKWLNRKATSGGTL